MDCRGPSEGWVSANDALYSADCDGFGVAVAEMSCTGEPDHHYDHLRVCGRVCASESRMRSSCRVYDDQVSVCESDSDGVEESGCESHMNPHCQSSCHGA